MSSKQPVFINVALSSPLRTTFDYLPEKGRAPCDYSVGCRVLVPFGHRKQIGIIIGHGTLNDVHPDAMKSIEKILDKQSLIPSSLWQLGLWLSDYYHHPIGDTFFTLLPNWLRRQQTLPQQELSYWQANKDKINSELLAELQTRAPKQHAALDFLLQQHDNVSAGTCRSSGHSSTTLKALQLKKLATLSSQVVPIDPGPALLPAMPSDTTREPSKTLSPEQSEAFNTIIQDIDQYRCHLLFGTTGSGKTEVYLQVIETTIKAKRQALVLIPEIGLTPQTIARFRRRFPGKIAVFHSGLNDKQRLAAWLAVKNGDADIAIGTRSAVFIPMRHPGVIIVDESHDGSYKQQEGLRYSARDTAIVRARYEKIPIILGTATPSLESLHNATSGKFTLHRLTTRANKASEPSLTFIDIRHIELHSGLSDEASHAICHCIEQQQQALVFINRRGYAPCLICQDCAWVARCHQCDARLTYHMQRKRLICHHCDNQSAVPLQCPGCQSAKLNAYGSGTERTALALQALLPNTAIIRIDRDTTNSRKKLEQQLSEAISGKPCVLVGTQMLAKGHHFPNLGTVIVLDIDQGLYSPDFRSAEQTLQLLTQVAGRAGRSEGQPGQVLIQTSLPDHPLLQYWSQNGYSGVAQYLLEERRQHNLPPFSYVAMIRADSPKANEALGYLNHVQTEHQAQYGSSGTITTLGPMPASMEKKAGRHRAQIQLTSPERGKLHAFIQQWLHLMQELPPKRGIRCTIDIDPIDV